MSVTSVRRVPAAAAGPGAGRFVVCSMLGLAAVVAMPSTAGAAGIEPAHVKIAASFIDDVVRGLLPIDIVLPGPVAPGPMTGPMTGPSDGGAMSASVAAVVTELRYCGAGDKATGRFRAVIRWGSFGGGSVPVLTGENACRPGLSDLRKQLGGGNNTGAANDDGPRDGVAIADLEAVWKPWELRLMVARTIGPPPPKPGPQRTFAGEAPAEGRRELLVIPTAGFHIATDVGKTITLHAAPAFLPDGIEIAAILGDSGSAPSTGRPPSGAGIPGIPNGANVVAELPLAFINQILRQLAGTQPFPISVDRDVIDLQNLSISAIGTALTVVGMATPRSLRETVRVTVQAGGDDPSVNAVRADPQVENCGGLGTLAAIGCNARNAGRSAAAAAFAVAMTHKYQGQLVRDLAGRQDFRFDVAGHHFDLREDLVQLRSGTHGLMLGARFAPGGSGN